MACRNELARVLLAGVFGAAACWPASAEEDRSARHPPSPMSDYALRARLRPSGEVVIAYRAGRMRVEILDEGSRVMLGLIDPAARKLVVLPRLPGLDELAVEVDLPAEFSFAAMPPESRRVGSDVVATEPCEVWRGLEPRSATPVESCFTADGIPLRAEATLATGRISFEATELDRAPQDPAAFELPPGTKVRRIPRSLQKLAPSPIPSNPTAP